MIQLEGASGLSTVNFGDSRTVKVGQGVITIGNAGGVGGTPSAAGGSVVALNQSITAQDDSASTSEHLQRPDRARRLAPAGRLRWPARRHPDT